MLACADEPSGGAASSEESGGGGSRCVSDQDGRGCRCGADVSEIAGWHEVAACSDPPAGEAWTCCDGAGSCACGVPRCLTFAGDRCLCGAFVETPADALGEVDSCSALICCDRGHECECSGVVLTCTEEGKVDECTPPAVGACAETADAVMACHAP